MGQAIFHVGVGRGLEGVGEGRERERAVFAFEGGLQDQVRQLRVFGQQTAVGIGREDVFVSCALRAILAVVAGTLEHPAEGPDAGAEIGLAGVIFKADDVAACFFAGEHIVADHPLLGADGVEIERAGKVALLAVPGLVVLAQHLIAAADGEHGHTVLDGGLELSGLLPFQVVQKDLLLKILAAADEDKVAVFRVELRTDRDVYDIRLHAAPLQPPLHAKDVAAVAVEVQHVGV